MTTNKIIIVSIVGLAVIGGAYYFYKKRKENADMLKAKADADKNIPKVDTNTKEECSKKEGVFWDEATKTCKPKRPFTAEEIKALQSIPNFGKIK
jgi:LPXTG-motif cell wall-anchored protein